MSGFIVTLAAVTIGVVIFLSIPGDLPTRLAAGMSIAAIVISLMTMVS